YGEWNCWTTSTQGCEYSLYNLPQTGTYRVQLIPGNGGTQTMSFTTAFSADPTGALSLNTPTQVTLGSVGESEVLTFTATAGQTVALSESGEATTPAGVWMGMTVYNSAGTQVASGAAGPSFTTINLPNLAADTYRVLVYPTVPATSNLQVTLEGGVGGVLPSDGTSTNYSTPAPGQNAHFTFSGTAGQSVSLALTNLVLTPSSPGYAQVYIYKPDGSQYGEWNCWTTSTQGCEYSLYNLAQTGTYRVQLIPGNGGTQTMSFTTAFSADPTGALSLNTPTQVTLGSVGESEVLTFTATAGQTVALS